MTRRTLTLFSWGYWGWGTATDRLIKTFDAIEAHRGFAPPVFVDVRLSRSVRAPGFNGNALGRVLGDRYQHLPRLGNTAIRTGRGPMRLARPEEAAALLGIALEALAQRRRVVFFCATTAATPERCLVTMRTANLVKRLSDDTVGAQLDSDICGNDASNRENSQKLPAERLLRPFILRVSWKTHTKAQVRFRGCYQLDLKGLLDGGYIYRDPDDSLRLKIQHDGGELFIRRTREGPMIRLP